MIYYSNTTVKGNSSYSHTSQQDAEDMAKYLDDHDCSNCSDCYNCSDCSGAVIQAGRPNSWNCYGWLKEGQLMIHCGCRRKTFSEAVEYWSNKPDRLEVLMACHYIASVAHSRGWKV